MTPESKIKSNVLSVLRSAESRGDIIWFSRLNSGKIKHSITGTWIQLCDKGTPDVIVLFPGADKRLICLFIEIKAQDHNGKLIGDQKLFQDSVITRHQDVRLLVARSVREVSRYLTDHGYNRVNDIEFSP